MELLSKETALEVDGQTYEIKNVLFLGRKSLSLAVRLSKKILPLMKTIGGLSEVNDFSKMEKVDIKKIKLPSNFFDKVSECLLEAADEKEICDLMFDLMSNTEINGAPLNKPGAFDLVFQGNLPLMFQVLKTVIIDNFSPFFKGGNITDMIKQSAGKISPQK